MRRVREWPRLVALAAVLAVLLVVIGVVVASAAGSGGGGSGGGGAGKSPSSSTPLLRAPNNDQSALVQSQAKTISRLRATVATQRGQIAALQQQVKRERALRRTQIHAKAKHHRKHHSQRR